MLRILLAAATLVAAFGTLAAPPAQADYDKGCELIHWGLFGGDRRMICDGPKAADGSWERKRMYFTPPYHRNASSTCSGGRYSSSCTYFEAADIPLEVHGTPEAYPVRDDNVLPDEPGWLPPGALVGNAT